MRILHFADLHLGVENFSRIDPATGLPTRYLDFLAALDNVVEYALHHDVDLVLFCGDAYKSREPTQTQQREFARRIRILSNAGIPIVLLVGNHDLPNASARATSTEIFHTLAVDNVHVSAKPEILQISTDTGPIQVATLPWLRRGALLTREETKNLSFEEIKQKMEAALAEQVMCHAQNVLPGIPAVLAAHIWVSGARPSSERGMVIGNEPGLLLSNVALPAFDYVALGHIHCHQVLWENPPVVYSGNLERIDFGEENDAKGFYLVDILNGGTNRKNAAYEFHELDGRPFVTIEAKIDENDLDPTGTIVRLIQEKHVKEAIVRVLIEIPGALNGLLRDSEIHEALKETQYHTISRNVTRITRIRLNSYSAEEIQPFDALKAWLDTRQASPERTRVLMEYADRLITAQRGADISN